MVDRKSLYLDTSAWIKLYVLEAGSQDVQDTVQRAEGLCMNALQETEFRNGIWAGMGRGLLNQRQAEAAIRLLETDFKSGLLAKESLDWAMIWEQSMRLSARYTPQLLTRTLDILHVAIAESLSYHCFVTGDSRQKQMCEALSISVIFVPARS